jgi:hypothetical protein
MSRVATVPIEDVLIDQGVLPNIRGRVTNTADLQAAMRQGNFLEEFPLSVVMYEDKYLL